MRRAFLLSAPILALCACQPPSVSPSPAATTSSPSAARPERAMVHLVGGRFLKYLAHKVTTGKVDRKERVGPEDRIGTSVSPFWIDKLEVTVADYRACREAGACPAPPPAPDAGSWDAMCNWDRPGFERDPINCIPPEAAEAYCAWVGARLPYDDEWQFAAMGLEGRDFPWGAKADERYHGGLPPDVLSRIEKSCPDATHDGTTTCPVGFDAWMATPEGVMDLAGNVAEITASVSGSTNRGIAHHALGASWLEATNARTILSLVRYPSEALEPGSARIGFRCARPEPLPSASPSPAEVPPSAMTRIARSSIPAFMIDLTRVTVAQYRACVRAGACQADGLTGDGTEQIELCTWSVPGLDRDPITCVTMKQVEAYCRWAGKRPLRADEWWLAVGGDQDRRYPWGNAFDEVHQLDVGFCRDAARGYHVWTCPVDKPRSTDSPEGVRDLAGLVGEWVHDDGRGIVKGMTESFAPLPRIVQIDRFDRARYHIGGIPSRTAFRCAKDVSP